MTAESPGWVLVPVEPTEAMLDAQHSILTDTVTAMRMPAIYRAMIAASPPPDREALIEAAYQAIYDEAAKDHDATRVGYATAAVDAILAELGRKP